jgi:hypothetical protein
VCVIGFIIINCDDVTNNYNAIKAGPPGPISRSTQQEKLTTNMLCVCVCFPSLLPPLSNVLVSSDTTAARSSGSSATSDDKSMLFFGCVAGDACAAFDNTCGW